MILERHYDEEALIALLHSGDGSGSRDPHLAHCASCTDLFDSYRVMSEVLGQKDVWELGETASEASAERGAASLRAFASAMESEDEQAAELIDELLSSPRQWWKATVERDERYHNAGVVRRLIEVSEAKIDTMPADSTELAASAIRVGEYLAETDATLQLIGAAYRQHAYALFYVGDSVRALDSVEAAQATLERCAVSDFALARLSIVRALVYGAQQRYDEALATAGAAVRVFRQFGERRRLASGLMTQAYLLITVHNYRGAMPILRDIQKNFANDVDAHTHALTFHNIAVCDQELGDVTSALSSYQIAAALYEDINNVTEAARIRHNIALLLSAEGKRAEARKRLRDCQVEFERLGMVHNSVLAALDLSEIALLENNFEEVEQLCHAAMRQIEAAGVSYSREALIALTYLREAAEQRRATQETFWHVKTYIGRLPDHPALLFAPAPLPPL